MLPSLDRTTRALSYPEIRVDDISVSYGDRQALEHLSFHLEQGALCALIGPNGAGKSTLFKALLGLVPLDSGSIELAGTSSQEARRRGVVGYVPQYSEIDETFPLTVSDVVMQGRYKMMNWLRIPSREDRLVMDAALERVDLRGFEKRGLSELSGGQRKRVFIARALAQEARILLLDEPYAGVDKSSESSLSDLVRSLTDQGMSALVAVHDLHTVQRHFDEALLINKRVYAHDEISSALSLDNLAHAFNVDQRLVAEMVS